MSLPTYYDLGTVSVANGGTTVTGVGTAWQGVVFAGDLFTDPAQGLFARVTADAVSDTSLSIKPWPGTTMTADAYEVLITPDATRVMARTRQVLEALGSALGVGFSPPVGMSSTDVQTAIEEVFDGLEAILPLPAGGATGRVLTKASGADGDAAWVDLWAGLTSLVLAGTSAGPAYITLGEDTDNGANLLTLRAPPALATDIVVTLPAHAGTLVTGPAPTTDNTIARFDGVAGALQESPVVVDDSGNTSGVGTLAIGATLSLLSADAGATAGPVITLDRNSASPAASDVIGAISFTGRNSVTGTVTYAQISTTIADATSGTEDATIVLQGIVAGAAVDLLKLSGTGMVLGAPTGGAQGAGTFNAAGRLYQNGNQLPYRLEGTATYDPPNLADAAGTTTTVTVTGAALGDIAMASFSLTTSGITITAWVSAANTVSVRFQNESGGALDIGSGTLKAWVLK